jgi:hypothetical protein
VTRAIFIIGFLVVAGASAQSDPRSVFNGDGYRDRSGWAGQPSTSDVWSASGSSEKRSTPPDSDAPAWQTTPWQWRDDRSREPGYRPIEGQQEFRPSMNEDASGYELRPEPSAQIPASVPQMGRNPTTTPFSVDDGGYRFRGDSDTSSTFLRGQAVDGQYRFRPLTEQERERQGQSSTLRSTGNAPGSNDAPDLLESMRAPQGQERQELRMWPSR